MKKKIISLMLLSFMTIASVSSAFAVTPHHHHHHHHHGHPHGH